MAQTSAAALHKSLSELQIAQKNPGASRAASKSITPNITKGAPVESWEDEINSSSEDNDASDTETEATSLSSPAPPPPTPSSPSQTSLPLHLSDKSPYRTFPPFGLESTPTSGETSPTRQSARSNGGDERRPEKSTAVASRLIAAGIGQKAPRRTKEQREYDSAVKVQEKKRRDAVREDEVRKKAEAEKAKRDIWDG